MNTQRILLCTMACLFLGLGMSALVHQLSSSSTMTHQWTPDTLPVRSGDRPETTNTNPHTQLNQQPTDLQFIDSLNQWVLA